MTRIAQLLVLSATAAALGPTAAQAQRVEIGPFAGWQFGGTLNTDAGRLGFEPALAWGGLLDVWVRGDGLAEILYSRQTTTVTLSQPSLPADSLLDVTAQYLHLGGLYEPATGTVRPFGGATAGITFFDPTDTELSGVTRFSLSFVGGGKAYFARRFGLRADARLFFTLFSDETEVFCRLPGACVVSVSGQLMSQAAVSAAAFVAF
jgi:hypothetical protein